MKKKYLIVLIVVIVGVVILGTTWYVRTNHGNALRKSLEQRIVEWDKQIAASDNSLLAAKALVRDYESIYQKTVLEYSEALANFNREKSDYDTLAKQYEELKRDYTGIYDALEVQRANWESDTNTVITVLGYSAPAKEHIERLASMYDDIEAAKQKALSKSQALEAMEKTVNTIKARYKSIEDSKKAWENQIVIFEAELLKAKQLKETQILGLQIAGSAAELERLSETAEAISSGFDTLAIFTRTVNEENEKRTQSVYDTNSKIEESSEIVIPKIEEVDLPKF